MPLGIPSVSAFKYGEIVHLVSHRVFHLGSAASVSVLAGLLATR